MTDTLRKVIGIIAAVGLTILIVVIGLVQFGVIDESFFLSDDGKAEKPDVSESSAPSEGDGKVYYTLSFVGDCTLESNRFQTLSGGSADYPFYNVADIFTADEATIANLECVFSDADLSSDSLFSFKAPTGNAAMLVSGGIDFVTTANNHTLDFGLRGLSDTLDTLDDVNVAYGKDRERTLFTTKNGLRLGFYCVNLPTDSGSIEKAVGALKDEGAEYIICAFHWGTEGSYRPSALQKSLAHAAIDAGADVVYGSHPHVLQPVEEYGDGIIMYSLGNFCFGGNSYPKDYDSVIVQLRLCRDENGSVSLASYELLPCSVSSSSANNDFRPTLYKESDSGYERALSKLDGSFTGSDLTVDYSALLPSQSPQPSDTPAPEPSLGPVPDGGDEVPIPSEDVDPDPIPVPEPIEPPTVTE